MYRFCPNCGEELPSPNPNFCPYCGSSLKEPKKVRFVTQKGDDAEKEVQRAIYELGVKLEECVAKILAAKGYKTQQRVRLDGSSGVSHEIDVLARRGNIVKAVECKNWKTPVGKEVIQKLHDTLKDLGSKWNGVVASFAGFTEDAENLAKHYGIELWDPDYLKEEFWVISVGRAVEASFGETIKVENAFPIKVNFSEAAEIKLNNKDKLITNGTLSYHPYYVVSYSYHAVFKDPTKKVHRFRDSGKVFIDALDGSVLNPTPLKTLSSVTKVLKGVISKKAREESKRAKKLIEEMEIGAPKNYEVRPGEDYSVRVLQPSISKRSLAKSAINYIVQKNTERIVYTPKSRKDEFLPETKFITYVPKTRDINIKSVRLVYIPKWEINYEAFNKTYTKEVLAFSGTVLEDTLRYCPKHIGLLKKENVAICEVCGQALCREHVFQCPVCGKWLCEDDGVFCEDCKRIHCTDHILKCEICGQPLCNDCKQICPICGKTVGKRHMRTCDNCGVTACTDCTTTIGIIRRKTLCKNCQNK